RDGDPRRNVEIDQREHDEIRADAEERGMAERDQPAVPGEEVPAEAHHGPHRHHRHDELLIAVRHEQRDQAVERDERQDPPAVTGACRKRCRLSRAHARLAAVPKRPSGRSRMITRNATKIAVFCSCVGRISAESCCTRPIVRPPKNAPRTLPRPPSTTPAYITITYSSPT